MTLERDIHPILIVSGSDKVYDHLAGILPKDEFMVSRASSAGEARRCLIESSFDIMFINSPLPDDFGVELAFDYSELPMGIIIMVKEDIYNRVSYDVENEGIITLQKPNSRQAIYSTVKLMAAVSAKLKRLDKKNQTLQEKMADIRIINHAKWLLIENKDMTEEEAHKYIEKKAMDSRRSKRETAQEVIDTFESR